MTVVKLKAFIEKDIRKIKNEREAAVPATRKNENLRAYLATRQHTLMQVLKLLNEK